MNRRFNVGILIACFSLSGVNLSWATETIAVSPIIVQPYDLQEINQQMLEQDRMNRDQELAIKGLIDDNQRLTDRALALKQDTTLDLVNQTMNKYRDYLLSRDRIRIMNNGLWPHRYDDLVHLTENVDDMKGFGQYIVLKRDVIEQKYKILNDLKNEMIALNEKLKARDIHKNFDKITRLQENKIEMLTQRLADMDQRIARYDETLAQKDRQIMQLKNSLAKAQSETAAKDEKINTQKDQVDLLKSELENKITQIRMLKGQLQELSSKDALIRSQADQINMASEQFKNQGSVYTKVQAEINALKNKMRLQANDLKAKDESIRWLNQVLTVTRDKANYYKLTSLQDAYSMKQIQGQVQGIKDDFARHFKDYDQFENAIVSLKTQVARLSLRLSHKQQQVELLKLQLQNKIIEKEQMVQSDLQLSQKKDQQVDLLKLQLENRLAEEMNNRQKDARIQQNLKSQLQDKEDQILRMQEDIRAILQDRANKEIYLHNESLQLDNRVALARELINLQTQETALLEEKNNLEAAQNDLFDQHALRLEKNFKTLLVNHKVQTADLQNRMEELQNELVQKQGQADSLREELENKIAQEKNQVVLADQIQDLKSQLQDKENQITSMQAQISSGQETQVQVDSLKQQLAQEQNEARSLKQDLESKNIQSNKMTLMMEDYQNKLESKNNAYNEQLRQLRQNQAEIFRIKKEMSEVEEMASARNIDLQTKDISLSMIQQKLLDEKTKELAMARQQLAGVPSRDELNYLRTGLKVATAQLKQKDEMVLKIKTDADEYLKEFNKQTSEFQSLKDQLLDAQQKINRKDDDLKYKNLEIIRLKDRFRDSENNWKAKVKMLTQKINDLQKGHPTIIGNEFSKNDPLQEKLKQALNKIDQQGRMINFLAQKLEDAGKKVDLTNFSANQ